MRDFFDYRGYTIGIKMIATKDGKWTNSTTFEAPEKSFQFPATTFVPAANDAVTGRAEVLARAKALLDQTPGAERRIAY